MKLKLYKTLVVPVLLYGCETWKMNKGDDKLVNMFQSKCLRSLRLYDSTSLRVHWSEQMRTEDLLERAQMKSLSEKVKARIWKMIGHTLRQDQ